jgi:hypothetical protein
MFEARIPGRLYQFTEQRLAFAEGLGSPTKTN